MDREECMEGVTMRGTLRQVVQAAVRPLRSLVMIAAAVAVCVGLPSLAQAQPALPDFVDTVDVDGHLELIGEKLGTALLIGLGIAVGLLVVFWAYRKAKALAAK